jgi:hypothetical protein
MYAKIFITRNGYDPEKGKHVKDPYLGASPSWGGCRPDIRRTIVKGGQVFVISGKLTGVSQFVMGGFTVADKIDALTAFKTMPEQRLHLREDGQLDGYIIIAKDGSQHELDTHPTTTFQKRIENYVVGRDPIALITPSEISRGRAETLEVLRSVLRKRGASPIEVVGRWGSDLTERQANELRSWLESLKDVR